MSKLYILDRYTRITIFFSLTNFNIQQRCGITIIYLTTNTDNLATVLSLLLILGHPSKLKITGTIAVSILALLLVSPAVNIGHIDATRFIVIDRISNKHIIWNMQFPIELTVLKTFENLEIFEIVTIPRVEYKEIDSSYLSSLNINNETSSKILLKEKTMLSSLINLKTALRTNIEKSLPQVNGELIKGFLFGGSDLNDKELKEDLKALGLSHIVSVSGFNFTIIQTALLSFTMVLRRKVIYIMSLIFFIGFYIFIGTLNLSAFRAMFMISVANLSLITGRPIRKANLIIITIGILALISPPSINNISFQLSIASTIGLTYLSEYISNSIRFKNTYLKSTISISITTFICTLPILANSFESLSWGGLIMNIVFLPFVPILMLLGFIISITGNSSNLGSALSITTEKISDLFIYLSNMFSNLQIFNVSSSNMILVTLILLILYLLWDYRKWERRHLHWK